tara:strand:- start:1568 stop:1861 length:294 start_codon:yes stop_codon:yes gene_type:complete
MSSIHKFSILKRPVITEKATMLQQDKRYVFEVDPSATKLEIKDAVESAFGVSVVHVNTMHVRGKSKRFGPKVSQLKSWKKAIVTLEQSDSITLFEGV